MRLWLTKISVVLITFMTFGMFIPPTYLDAEAENPELLVPEVKTSSSVLPNSELGSSSDVSFSKLNEPINAYEHFISSVTEQARHQSFQKFGPKIVGHVEDEFIEVILPKVEEVIRELVQGVKEGDLVRFEMTEKSSSGYGEKIFHIFDQDANKDVARFHVKRVNHPKKGHSFNFHYHLYTDKFENHYHLGDIYWDKNTPPKWMA